MANYLNPKTGGTIGYQETKGTTAETFNAPMMWQSSSLSYVTLMADASGNLMTVGSGGGGGSNAAAGLTGVAPPTSASYTAYNNAGILTGASLTNGFPIQSATGATFSVTGVFYQTTQPISGSVSVSNFPSSQTITGAVSVNNFPATQAVTGTFYQATQPVSGNFYQATQPVSNTSLPNETGTWSYNSGTSGTPSITAGKRVLQITAIGGTGGGSLTINGGNTVTVPQDASITITPRANLIAPTIVFTNTSAYFVELLT